MLKAVQWGDYTCMHKQNRRKSITTFIVYRDTTNTYACLWLKVHEGMLYICVCLEWINNENSPNQTTLARILWG